MVVSRTLRATTACASCRLSILRSFTSLAGPSFRSPQLSARVSRCSRSNQQFGTLSRLLSNAQIHQSSRLKNEAEEGMLAEESSLEDSEKVGEGEVADVPWYLQVESPHRAPKPLSERQRLPELPVSSPPILQPLLQQISIDLGLDDLSLLDIRKLDPPPALGANLLMLLATARSEKHLHVSADRLCRWLRSNYKLRPDADGLLGRNELKLKLKRKAKRAKLMGNVKDDQGDDGVRTGWVCVDVGVVDGGETITDTPRQDNFVGFGRRTDGVRIVVQMLIEEKREEMELEKLWSGILRRGGERESESEPVEIEPRITAVQSGSVPTERTSLAVTLGRGQVRELHTAAPRMTFTASSKHFELDIKAMEDLLMVDIVAGAFEKAMNDLRQSIPYTSFLQQGKWKLLLLKLLRRYLEQVPRERAIQELSVLDSGATTPPYMACFNELLSSFPTEFEAETRIWLACFARDLGHQGYTQSKLFELFLELQGFGVRISQASYIRLLKGILGSSKGEVPAPPRALAEMALKILQAMHDQGMEILNEDLLVNIQEAVAPSHSAEDPPQSAIYTDSGDTFELPSLPMSPIQSRLHALIISLQLPLFKDVSRMRLMDVYARLGHWKEFFEIFRMAPNQGKSQSGNVYAFMFGSVAQTGHQKSCMAVLRTWIPGLELENPSVALEGDVGEAVKACLRIADPFVEQNAVDSRESMGEWLEMWRRIK